MLVAQVIAHVSPARLRRHLRPWFVVFRVRQRGRRVGDLNGLELGMSHGTTSVLKGDIGDGCLVRLADGARVISTSSLSLIWDTR